MSNRIFIAVAVGSLWTIRCALTGRTSPTPQTTREAAEELALWCEIYFARGAHS